MSNAATMTAHGRLAEILQGLAILGRDMPHVPQEHVENTYAGAGGFVQMHIKQIEEGIRLSNAIQADPRFAQWPRRQLVPDIIHHLSGYRDQIAWMTADLPEAIRKVSSLRCEACQDAYRKAAASHGSDLMALAAELWSAARWTPPANLDKVPERGDTKARRAYLLTQFHMMRDSGQMKTQGDFVVKMTAATGYGRTMIMDDLTALRKAGEIPPLKRKRTETNREDVIDPKRRQRAGR